LSEASAALARSFVVEDAHGGGTTEAHSPILIWASGPDALCNYFNDAWLAFTGRSVAQEMGDGWAAGVHADDLGPCVETYRTAFARRERFRMEYRLRRRDGVYRRILDAGTPRFADDDGSFLGFIGGCIDVTDLRAAQEARDTLQARLECVAQEWTRAFDSLDVGVFVLDETATVRRLNRAALVLSGRDRYDEIIGRPVHEIGTAPPWATALELCRDVAGGRPKTRAIRSPEDGRSWEIGAAPMVTQEGTSRWTIVTLRDTTEVTKLQEALRNSESMAALGALVSGVAHEVRNPLFGISATIQLLQSRFQDRPEYQQYGAMLNGNVQRLMELMQDLLDYARPVEPQFADVSLAAIVDEAVRACSASAEPREVAIHSELRPDLEDVRGDRRRLVQVFQNVISNAVAFSPPASTVRVRACVGPTEVRCEVDDSGGGFSPDEIRRVFDPFFTRRCGGTGLGLSIARRIVEAHGGTLTAANRPAGAGARITLTLPRHPRGARDPKP
jgi:PAS domain S-box-containing protein